MSANAQSPCLYHLTETLSEDIAKLRSMAEQFATGELAEAQFKAFRVPMGVYEQRESGTYMLRVRLPAGAVLPHQMRVLAQVSRQFGNGVLHFTTRQDIQVHSVPLEAIADGLEALQAAGLSTKGGGGNTVRTITSCADSGVCAHEAFDIAPHVVALTEFLLPAPLSYQLPRKYKLAVSGCERDCAGAAVNDLGLVATLRDGIRGFTVYAAGGMGAHSAVGQVLEEFIPAEDACYVAEAVKRVFDQHGNRKNRNRARIRFLVEDIGFDAFRALYRDELAKLRKTLPARPELRALPQPGLAQAAAAELDAAPIAAPTEAEPSAWRALNVRPQAQAGANLVSIPLILGDISAESLEGLADVVEQHGEGLLRATQAQNAVLRWVTDRQLPAAYQRLRGLGLTRADEPILQNLVPCTGAATCKLGICLSRGLAEAIVERLRRSQLSLQSLGDLRISISGCPNSCGRHPVADVGFSGAARRVDGRLAPHYAVHVGGSIGAGPARLASEIGLVPARNVPDFLTELLARFAGNAFPLDFTAFSTAEQDAIRALVSAHQHVPAFTEDRNYYYDWGAWEPFSLAGRGPGECGAGVFELIEVDLASAAAAWERGQHFAATALAARALLVTRGEQADNDRAALELFKTHFVLPKLVTPDHAWLIEEALLAGQAADPDGAFAGRAEAVGAFVAAVRQLYDSMDASLRPMPSGDAVTPEPASTAAVAPADVTKDFRDTACPMNYVKTKLALEGMQPGQVLAVLLNEQGAQNVPGSVESDGHEVLETRSEGDHWRILVRKARG